MRISDWSSDVCSSDLVDSGLRESRVGSLQPLEGARPCQQTQSHRLPLSASGSPCYPLCLAAHEIPDSPVIAAWAEDYNQERPHSSLGYESPAAFAAELHKQWPASLRPTGSAAQAIRSEEHTSELQSLMRISYAVFCLNKTKK